ncbi:tRNA (adenine-N6-)-methyltransferase [Aureococcus anophagefferens]|nr:tRNA (adenine-N6-)-methyltransferase [Aureococcus anophagefferens]
MSQRSAAALAALAGAAGLCAWRWYREARRLRRLVAAAALPLRQIGVVESCYRDVQGTPRQPLLAPTARAVCVLDKAVVEACALEGLDRHSHVWLLFAFHENTNGRKRAVRARRSPWTSRPPRDKPYRTRFDGVLVEYVVGDSRVDVVAATRGASGSGGAGAGARDAARPTSRPSTRRPSPGSTCARPSRRCGSRARRARPAAAAWTLDGLADRCGERRVLVRQRVTSAAYRRGAASPVERMRFRRYVDELRAGRVDAYMAAARRGVELWPPTLREEMAPNDLGADGRTVQSSAPGPEPAAVFELGAGDALFIPAFAWHRVTSTEESISLNFFFGDDAGYVAKVLDRPTFRLWLLNVLEQNAAGLPLILDHLDAAVSLLLKQQWADAATRRELDAIRAFVYDHLEAHRPGAVAPGDRDARGRGDAGAAPPPGARLKIRGLRNRGA